MYDSGKIIAGLAIFILLITFPIWYNNLGTVSAAPGKDSKLTEDMFQGIRFPNDARHALTSEEMRATHMNMLKDIHAKVTGYNPAKDGLKEQMSCVMCHGSTAQFCTSCHDYVSVAPVNCADCHQQ